MNPPATTNRTQLIVALDFPTFSPAADLVQKLGDTVLWYKVGKQLFTATGPEAVRRLKRQGKNVFLDLKFHDIPHTVGQAVSAALKLGADMVNVHASGGRAMLEAAAAARQTGAPNAIVLGVTVLTSLDDAALNEVGVKNSAAAQVVRLARLAQDSGIQGVVASAMEIADIRRNCGPDFTLVIPGIRPAGAAVGDQKRVMTPGAAARVGADYIVVGRPISQAKDPAAAAIAIQAELEEAANG